MKSKSHIFVFCQLEEPTNVYNRIIKSSPFLISLSYHEVSKSFWILRGEKKNMNDEE